jgi:tetratricopeptide (TPR) repeat protein
VTGRRQAWIAGGAIAIAGAIAYSNGLHGPFVFDDPSSITGNPTIRHLSDWAAVLRAPQTTVTAQGRPMLNLSLAVNYALGGKEVLGYHLTNVLIHLCAGWALWGILRRIWREDIWVPSAVAVLWVVHPLQTESVTYTVQRAESLMGLFYLLTVFCFIGGAESAPGTGRRARRLGSAFAALSVGACFLGMATKEDMASAPVVVLLFDRTFVAGTFAAALRLRWKYYGWLASSWILLGYLIWSTGGNRGGSVGFNLDIGAYDYWLTQFPALLTYLRLAFWPHPLVFEYGTFWIYHLSAVWLQAWVVLMLVAATGWALVRRSAAGFAGFFFFALMAPTSLLPGTTQMIVEHRMYLPLAAVLAVAFGGLARLSRPLAVGVAVAAAVGCIVLTRKRNADYRDAVRLWQITVAQRPSNVLAHTMLAQALDADGRPDEAREHFLRATELNPHFALAQEGLGENLAKRGDLDDAIGHYRAAIHAKADFADAHDNLGVALGRQKQWSEAVAEIHEALRINPEYSTAHYNLAGVLADSGQKPAAVAEYRMALAQNPQYAEAAYNLGNTLGDLGRIEEAISAYQDAIRARPDYAKAEYNLANALVQARRLAEAVPHYQAALRLQPNDPDAENNLGGALWELGRLAEAETHFEAVLRLTPLDPAARENLQKVRAAMAPSAQR